MNGINTESTVLYKIDYLREQSSNQNKKLDFITKIIETLPFEESDKRLLSKMATAKVYDEEGIPIRVGDMQRESVQSTGPGIVLLGYYNSESERWAYAPDTHGRVLDIDGKTLQDGKKTWIGDHTPTKLTGLIESVDICGRKYLLIAANKGYVPARTDEDAHLQGWTSLDSKIRVVFDKKCMPHPACARIDYTQHGFVLEADRMWWPISNGTFQEERAQGALVIASKKLQALTLTTLKDPPSDIVYINASHLQLSADIQHFIDSVREGYEKMNSPNPNRDKNPDAQMYLKIAFSILEVYKEYDSIPIDKKFQYLQSLNQEMLANLLEQTTELNDRLESNQLIDFREAALGLEQFFITNFKIMTKNGSDTSAFVERPYTFWVDTLNDIADDRERVQKVEETNGLVEPDPLLRDLTDLFKQVDKENRANYHKKFKLTAEIGYYSSAVAGAGIGSFFGPFGMFAGALIGSGVAFTTAFTIAVIEHHRRKEPSRRQTVSAETNI